MAQQRKEVEYLIHLLSCALNGTKPEVQEDVNYSALLKLSEKHQVYNIIFPIIKDLDCVPDEYKKSFKSYNLSEISRMLVINNEREQIYDVFDESGIRYMPLKGLIIRNYYPKSSMRQMSDNDILIDEKYRDDIAGLMKENGYKPVATGENTDDYFKAPYCTFEFHRTLFFKESDFCPVFENLWDRATKDEERPCMYHMGVDDVYIYSVCHMYKHFSTAGCGIRFLADNYLILKKEEGNLDWAYINSFFEKYNLSDYEQKCRRLAFKLFEQKPLYEDDYELLETFINYGIFGSGKISLTNKISKLAQDSDMETAKKKYILYRLFPPKKKMIADFRILEKKPYLLPLYYIIRLFKGAKNAKKTVKELNSINNIES